MKRCRRPLLLRLLARLSRPSDDACWVWTGFRDRKGYGQIALDGRRGVHGYTHRVAWELHNGPIPDGLWVLHRCDNPPCCNPAHLFLGTAADNNRDMAAKGRHVGTTKLTSRQVVEIVCNRGVLSQTQLAKVYGVSNATVSYAINTRAA